MIALEKQELLEKCLNSLDYDLDRFDSKYRRRTCHSRTLNRRKAVLELFLRQKNYTIKELSEILNVSYAQARNIDFRACRALRNVIRLNDIDVNDLI